VTILVNDAWNFDELQEWITRGYLWGYEIWPCPREDYDQEPLFTDILLIEPSWSWWRWWYSSTMICFFIENNSRFVSYCVMPRTISWIILLFCRK
jgi:hypothetical protein